MQTKPGKIESVDVLVHPYHSLQTARTASKIFELMGVETVTSDALTDSSYLGKSIETARKFGRKDLKQVKIMGRSWGKKVLEAQEDPTKLFVLVVQNKELVLETLQEIRNAKSQTHDSGKVKPILFELARLVDFAQKKLGNRLILVDDKKLAKIPTTIKERKFTFNPKNLKIRGFGELGDQPELEGERCVTKRTRAITQSLGAKKYELPPQLTVQRVMQYPAKFKASERRALKRTQKPRVL